MALSEAPDMVGLWSLGLVEVVGAGPGSWL